MGTLIGDDSTSKVYDIGDGKVLKISKNGQSLEKEAKLQSKMIGHAPEICSFKDNWIIMEKMDGTLYDLLKKKKPNSPQFNMIKDVAKHDIRRSIKKMHAMGIVHADIKSSNVFYKIIDNHYKFYLGDYGMAMKTKKDLSNKTIVMKLIMRRWGGSNDIRFMVNEIFNTIRYEFEVMCN